tara:strand:- start:470 stop:2179 length:1710 start_codon:yes stop_codon:yes gene_type:complete
MAVAASTECADGIDNDFDGKIDYPQDPQCLSLHDQTEGASGRGIFLDITDGLKTVQANGHMTYTIALNNDRQTSKNVNVQFFIPHQANYLSATNGGDKIGDYVVWRNVTVYPGRTRKLYVNVAVKPRADQDLLVVAKAYAEGEEATDITRIQGITDDPEHQPTHQLRLSVSDGKAYAEPNERLVYRIVVDNTNGPGRSYRLRTDLSVFLNYVAATGSPRVDKSIVEWTSLQIDPDEIQEYYLTAEVDRGAPNNANLQLKVSSGPSIARDTTGIFTGTPSSALTASITDGLDSAVAKEYVAYTVTIRNTTNKLATDVDANVALPSFMEFVSATEGGLWTGKNVHWTGLTVSPRGSRSLNVTGRIRSDAKMGAQLRATVNVKGNAASDTTFVSNKRIMAGGDSALLPTPSAISMRSPVLLRKVADRSEVRPGDTVSYTIYLRNNTKKPFNNITVQERLNDRYMQVTGSPNAKKEAGRLSWTVASLAPGKEWTTRYTARVSDYAPSGIAIKNVASVSGDGIETFSLTERVYTSSMDVVTNLPPSGVGFGGIFLGFTGLLGALQTGLMRRRLI